MILTQDFDADFLALTAGLARDYSGPPYAFVRFGDGEAAIMRGRPHRAKSDGWCVSAADSATSIVSRSLFESLFAAAKLENYYIGISAHEHDADAHDFLNNGAWSNCRETCDRRRLTYAELFCFANYRRWLEIDTSHCLHVGPSGSCFFHIPHDAVMTGWRHGSLVESLIADARSPILVSAGPLANIIIHDYWRKCPPDRRRVILDVGSALDVLTKGRKTRRYHNPRDARANWKPRFWPAG